ncbi:NADH-quinone oxidoreductase subunit NuoE [Roseobacter denitrificans]|uniref:NADH-quinone oxidoreductase chain E n=1 Tax=Roseobacter denitrificans (strain ATCC 33942 / OCh 114) TaxID=375451 RepID=Q163Q7_ROSDO|nr:NADH-quinone oxidoreductase subunit NuoE [Roseobacter denitrificans]ABG32786.1 NADH-quinone oxidoreductase chain E [Roseobacter denitrificans OCh 114]AVL52197.1 NADH-quinone oxidoreductase subunit NuoE [Roseobacter denitrificans]SFF94921.1 NADH dehydrogenase subunit E [Roseobacter denitrificans OCh 114]
MLRRLHPDQPDSFAFTPENQAWAEGQITKYPEGRQASAIIPLLWRAQEQEGWLSKPAIEHVSDMLGLSYIRGLEVATFYFMFQLQPVGAIAHIQVCGTTSCMICGAEDLVAVCQEKIAREPHQLSEDGNFSWEEVECLGSCSNAPMAQIGKDYYEDLTAARMGEIIDELAAGKVPVPGPQNGRYAAEPLKGLTSLTEYDSGRTQYNASVQLAVDLGDTIKRIDGTEVPLTTPWQGANENAAPKPRAKPQGAPAQAEPDAPVKGVQPGLLKAARSGGGDDLKRIKGVGPKLESMLNDIGIFHFDQIASWTKEEVAWADESFVGFKGRVSRDDWVAQAKLLAEGKETEFSQRAEKDGIYKK